MLVEELEELAHKVQQESVSLVQVLVLTVIYQSSLVMELFRLQGLSEAQQAQQEQVVAQVEAAQDVWNVVPYCLDHSQEPPAKLLLI